MLILKINNQVIESRFEKKHFINRFKVASLIRGYNMTTTLLSLPSILQWSVLAFIYSATQFGLHLKLHFKISLLP